MYSPCTRTASGVITSGPLGSLREPDTWHSAKDVEISTTDTGVGMAINDKGSGVRFRRARLQGAIGVHPL